MKYNPPVIQRVGLSSAERNVSIPAKLATIDDAKDIKLCGEAMIRANRYLFKSGITISKYMEMFDLDKNRLMV